MVWIKAWQKSERGALLQLLSEIRGLRLFGIVEEALRKTAQCSACHADIKEADFLDERMTVFLLLSPKEMWDSIKDGSVRVCLLTSYITAFS